MVRQSGAIPQTGAFGLGRPLPARVSVGVELHGSAEANLERGAQWIARDAIRGLGHGYGYQGAEVVARTPPDTMTVRS